ncbi:MAG TPA: hypothetical protein DDY16_07730 [Tenacibaculum sp.]|nr:hypothetical protein [Tenacibaculum sp.]
MNIIGSESKLVKRQKKKHSKPEKNITNINHNKTTTYRINPKSFRMTENDIDKLKSLVESMIQETGKSYTGSKVLRGLIHLSEKIDVKKIIKSTDLNT